MSWTKAVEVKLFEVGKKLKVFSLRDETPIASN